jgi:hypothetical protein
MEREADEVDTGTGEWTETEEQAVEEGEVNGERSEVNGKTGADGRKIEEELPKDAPEWAVKRFGKLTAKRHEAEEARAAAEAERDQYKQEAEQAKAKYTDRDILQTARRAGILPELLTKSEAETLSQADKLTQDVERLQEALDENPDGWTANGQTVSAAEARRWLRKAKTELEEIADDAAVIRKAKAAEVRELLKLGREAKAAGTVNGKRSAVNGERSAAGGERAPVRVRPTAGAAAAAGAGVRRAATETGAAGPGELSKIKDEKGMLEYLTRKHGG